MKTSNPPMPVWPRLPAPRAPWRPGQGGQAGFTLIELLVVVAALSILTATVGLSLSSRDRAQRSDPARLAELDAGLRSKALFGRAPVGFRIGKDGIAPVKLDRDGWLEDGTAIRWQGDAAWTGLGVPDPGGFVVAYLPDGRNAPFSVLFRQGISSRTCRADGWRPAECDAE